MPAAIDISEDTATPLERLPTRDARSLISFGSGAFVLVAVFAGVVGGVVAPMQPGGGLPGLVTSVLPLVLASVAALAAIFYLAGSSTQFNVIDGDLLVEEHLGPIRWTRARKLAGIRKLTIRHLFASSRTEMAPPPKDDDVALLCIECRGCPELRCAHGYRRQQLVQLAAQLSRLCSKLTTDEPIDGRSVAIVEEDEATLFEERDERPANSTIEFEEHTDGVTIHIPRQGFRSIRSLLFFSPGVLAIVLHFGVLFLAALPNPDLFDFLSLSIGVFALICYVWALVVRMRSESVFAVVGEQLLVMQTGFQGSKQLSWVRAELYDVRSGVGYHNRRKSAESELQIWKRDGKKVSFLRGRDEHELRWMATMIRRALRVPPRREELAPPKFDQVEQDDRVGANS